MSDILRIRRAWLFAIALATVATPHAYGQAAIVADATVPLASPTGAGAARNLAFGTVTITPGTTTVIDVPADPSLQSASVFSAEFAYGVSGMAGLDLSFSLPTQLTSTVGNIPLAISFNGTQYGGYCATTGAGACSLTNFNPTAAGVVRVCKGYKGNGDCKNQVWGAGTTVHAFIGGAITVPPTQVAATYTGTITSYIVQVY